MSEVILCDECGTTGKIESIVNWYKLERYGTFFTTGHNARSEWHFCSASCVATWGMKNQGPIPASVGSEET